MAYFLKFKIDKGLWLICFKFKIDEGLWVICFQFEIIKCCGLFNIFLRGNLVLSASVAQLSSTYMLLEDLARNPPLQGSLRAQAYGPQQHWFLYC